MDTKFENNMILKVYSLMFWNVILKQKSSFLSNGNTFPFFEHTLKEILNFETHAILNFEGCLVFFYSYFLNH